MRRPGVGIVYWPELEPVLEPGGPVVSVVELEPQALWDLTFDGAAWRYRGNEALLERVVALPQAKLVHGIGHPFGGTAADPVNPVALLRHDVDRLDPVWVSEHLSFNRVQRDGAVEHAGFLLPPPQSPAAVRVAAHNIDQFRAATDRPVAFETGVNYLRPRAGEMDDGRFFAAVAEAADSGIVLDLHNLWCNERNGRQRMAEAIAQIPLDRVWEVHLAGGMEEGGYWLDAHSGAVPPQVMELAAQLVPRLPNLGALIFEVLPQHLPRIGIEGVQRQIESVHRLWELHAPRVLRPGRVDRERLCVDPATAADIAAVAAWESEFVDALRARPQTAPGGAGLREDPGCALLATLVGDFRRANLARALHYTMTALLAGLGAHATRTLLDTYFEQYPPDPFAAIEADRFAQFLAARVPLLPRIPFLDEVLAFEHALVRATVYGVSSEIGWSADPVMLFESLDAGALPLGLAGCRSTMRICAA